MTRYDVAMVKKQIPKMHAEHDTFFYRFHSVVLIRINYVLEDTV
jgi:hypothetical protein